MMKGLGRWEGTSGRLGVRASRSPRRHRATKRLVGILDGLLRLHLGVYEYTGDPECIFRIASRAARADVKLQDGTFVRAGDAIVELHLWNEQLPRVPPDGATLAWGAVMDQYSRRSLALLAAYLAAYPEVVAVHGEAAFGCQMGHRQGVRLARRYGFDIVGGRSTLLDHARHFCDDFLFWVLTWAYNPHSLKGKAFRRPRHHVWISRAELTRRWGNDVTE